MKAFWNKNRHWIIAGLIVAGFGYAAFRISPLAAGLVVGCVVAVAVAVWISKKP